jgi:uncharacterized protein (DUF1697 family)
MKSKQDNIRYIAFLRGINVSGQKIIKMEALAKMFSSFGFKNVKTFIQSGNVILDSDETDVDSLRMKIEKNLAKKLGYQVDVIVRTLAQLESMIARNPFKKFSEDAKISVAFMSEKPKVKVKLPLFSSKKDVEIFEIKDCDAFCVHYLVDGKSGYPNLLIEKSLGVKSTVRFWSSINKMVTVAKSV